LRPHCNRDEIYKPYALSARPTEPLLSDLNLSFPLGRTDSLPATIAERTRRIYDLVAEVYPLSTMFFHARAHCLALEESRIRDGMRVLEVATGSGEMFRRLVRANPHGRTFGLDLSPKMAARTQRRVRKEFPFARAHCEAVDVRHMPFRDESFDVVVCCYLFELLSGEDIRLTLNEFRRVLCCGGVLALVVIGQQRRAFNNLYKICGRLVPAFWGRQVERSVPDLLEAHSLRIVSDRTITQGFYPSRIFAARKQDL
jgi:ubiquinone/menaquinone biosynthesis C-methylase UbiE